jgi:hypothetical protein
MLEPEGGEVRVTLRQARHGMQPIREREPERREPACGVQAGRATLAADTSTPSWRAPSVEGSA